MIYGKGDKEKNQSLNALFIFYFIIIIFLPATFKSLMSVKSNYEVKSMAK